MPEWIDSSPFSNTTQRPVSSPNIWKQCLEKLESELSSQQFSTWIQPLQAVHRGANLRLLAPNRFVMDWVRDRFFDRITELVAQHNDQGKVTVSIEVGSKNQQTGGKTPAAPAAVTRVANRIDSPAVRLNSEFTFETHIEGKSNQLARAAAMQVGENPGGAYNPLFIYGGVGLGKTHLMQAAGNRMLQHNPEANVAYVHSERFVADMVKGLQHNAINEFKKFYRSLDALLIDDIQFFVGKERSQEEFFHTFNALLEGQRQVIITSDRFPKELVGVEERLVSRFGSGLTVSIDPPELETRVAILMNKARQENTELPEDVAFLIANKVRSNVRDLEGALRRVIAGSRFTGQPIDTALAMENLKDLLSFQERMITVNNIQKTVAEYFKIRVADLLSKSRARQVARPRQMAMTLAKELTDHSLPEIGDFFGGRDHTTVLHATRKIKELKDSNTRVKEDYENLLRILTA